MSMNFFFIVTEALFNLDLIENLGVNQQQDVSTNKHRKRMSIKPGLHSDMAARKPSQKKRVSGQPFVNSIYKPLLSVNQTSTSTTEDVNHSDQKSLTLAAIRRHTVAEGSSRHASIKALHKPLPSDSDVDSLSSTSKHTAGRLLVQVTYSVCVDYVNILHT